MDQLQDPPYISGMERVTSYAEATEILRRTDFTAGGFEAESLPFRGCTLIELDGADHLQRRRIEAPLFTKPMLDQYEHRVLAPAIARCLTECRSTRDTDGVVRADLVRLTRRMLLQIAAAVIGLDGVETPERTDLLERCMYPLNAAVDVKFATRDHTDIVTEGLEAKSVFLEQLYNPSAARRAELIGQHRRGELTAASLPVDLISILLQHPEDSWDEDLPAREAILYLAGATETTSNAVTHAVVELEGWLSDHPEDSVRLHDSGFLRGVCNEALRLHPNITGLVRRSSADITLATGRRVRAGQHLALNFVEANRDPEVFGPDAHSFDPRRELPDDVRPYGLAFGAGRHVCIGRPLVTTVSGKLAAEGESDRAMIRILQALLDAGVKLDPEAAPRYAETAEQVYASLPVKLPGLR